MMGYKWWWAYRFHVSDEPAILVLSRQYQSLRDVVKIVIGCDLIHNTRGINQVLLEEHEWIVWYGFDLCPIIEIYEGGKDCRTSSGLLWRAVTDK